jgi:pyruvate formate lyase activating enzyme
MVSFIRLLSMQKSGHHPTVFWEALPNGRVQCDVCPNHCRLAEGQRGACFVRMAQGGEIVLTTYGRSSGFCIDPVEKKPLNHFLPGTPILSFGTAGCNLTCRFCQNWDISKSREMDTLNADAATPAAIARAAQGSMVAPAWPSPTTTPSSSWSTPWTSPRPVTTLGVKAVAVTAGYMCAAPRRAFFAHMDAANVDLKGFTPRFYKELCGAELETVKETLVYLKRETAVWLEITTLLIPGENDSDRPRWTRSPLGGGGTRTGRPAALHRLPSRLQDAGPAAHAAGHANARAPHRPAQRPALRLHRATCTMSRAAAPSARVAGRRVIGRDWFELTDWPSRTTAIAVAVAARASPGVFNGPPGTWGARRQPVRLRDRM